MQPTTDWRRVGLLIGAGLLAACQVGKAAVALPQLRGDLALSLTAASWVVSAYGSLGAVAGLVVGVLIARIGARTALLCGLALIVLGSFTGALAADVGQLLASRIVEGCGFLGVVISAPAILSRVAAPKDRSVCFAAWGAYMPIGTASMMIIGPFLITFGWRVLWIANAVTVLAYALLLLKALPCDEAEPAEQRRRLLHGLGRVSTARGPLLLALAFGTYTFQYFALTTLFPTLLVERLGLSIPSAGTLSALVVVANAVGNLSAGGLVRLGIPLWAIAAAGFASVGLCSIGVFSDLPIVWICVCAAASLAISGTIPASIFAAAPTLAPAPYLIPITLGLIMQASNLGQLLGPAALAAWIEHLDWRSAWVVFGFVTAAGLTTAAAFRARLRRGGV